MSSDLHNQIYNLQQEVEYLRKRVKTWSTNCAYVAGSSIGIILFLQLFSEPTATVADCPEPPPIVEQAHILKEVPIPKVSVEEPLIEVPKKPIIKAVIEEPPPKEVLPEELIYTFPMTYQIQNGDSFGRIAQRFYKRASLGKWLSSQNGIDPAKMRIGQEITLPSPP